MKTLYITFTLWAAFGSSLLACPGVSGWAGVASTIDPELTMLVYDPSNGKLTFYPGLAQANWLEMTSEDSLFIPENANPNSFTGLFDGVREKDLLKIGDPEIEISDLGNILPTGLTAEFLLDDLNMFVLLGSNIPLLHVVPEPHSLAIPILLFFFSISRRMLMQGV